MITNVSSKSNRINVKNLVFCTLTSDDSSGVVYGDVYPLAKAMTIEVTRHVFSGVFPLNEYCSTVQSIEAFPIF